MSSMKPLGMIAAGTLAIGTAVGIIAAHAMPARPRREAEWAPDETPIVVLTAELPDQWRDPFVVAAREVSARGFFLHVEGHTPRIYPPLEDSPYEEDPSNPPHMRARRGLIAVTLRGQAFDDDHIGETYAWYVAKPPEASKRSRHRIYSVEIAVPEVSGLRYRDALAIARHELGCHAMGFRHVQRRGHWFSAKDSWLGNDDTGVRPT